MKAALQREQNWLAGHMDSLVQTNTDSWIANSMRTGWEEGYLALDSKAIAFEIWLNQNC